MRHLLLALTFSSALSTSALAGQDWSGGYLGLSLGYADANDAWAEEGDPDNPTLSPEGGALSAYAGFGVDLGGLILGLEADVSIPDLSESETCEVLVECSFDVELMASLRAHAGVALGPVHIYGTGGPALGYIQADSDEIGGTSEHRGLAGWTAGAGVEYQTLNTVRLGVEYRHSEYRDIDIDLGAPAGQVSLETDELKLRLGIVF